MSAREDSRSRSPRTGRRPGGRTTPTTSTTSPVSDIGYQGTDPATGQSDTSNGRSLAYLPIVAGGTSMPYQVKINGTDVTNLRLSGLTVAKIFTGQITNWDDPAIKKDNPGLKMPDLQIIPVVHSEGSGSTYQFTRYLATEYPSVWKTISSINGGTEYFPTSGSSAAVRESSVPTRS